MPDKANLGGKVWASCFALNANTAHVQLDMHSTREKVSLVPLPYHSLSFKFELLAAQNVYETA